MDPLAEGEGPVMAAAREISPPQRRSARRKLVQSTLFPHKSPELESTADGEKDCDRGDEDCHEEECTGSQGKKKRRRKEKATPQPKTPRKSPGKGTPKKSKQASPGVALVPAPIPNLRLEAKLLAEETSRIFAGKGVHPFFSLWKGSKKTNEEGTESNCCGSEKKEKRGAASIGPIHVFEKDQVDAVPLDWRNWQFCEGLLARSSSYVQGRDPSVSEGSSEFLGVDNVSSGLYPKGTSALPDDGHFDPSFNTHDLCGQPIKDAETDSKVGKVGLVSECTGELDMKHQLSDLGQERIMSSYLGSADKLKDSLWIDKYQPRNSMEVCGNDEPVKFLSEWLHNWQQGGSISKRSSGGDEYDMHDTDYSCLQNDSDSEDMHEKSGLKNVLLITGPVGCGKSAAIYACAKEQGFKILEVNTSDCRNGAMVKQRFGEALDSHSLEWSRESQMDSHSSQDMNFATASGKYRMNQEFDDEVLEVIPTPDEDNCSRVSERSWKLVCKDSAIACHRGPLKHLILFEDVDVTFAEDRGFIAAIQQIADKAKGPVILTSNSYDPVLPSNLDRLDLSFMMPSMKELLQHVNMVCSEEKVNIQPHLIEQLVDYCNRDIRKTIMHLQFWHQGGEVERLSSPLVFDPEIGHQILPKMIPWGFPSQLSELVEKEISVSLSKMEELSFFVELNIEEFGSQAMQNSFKMDDFETGSLEAKKEAMLSRLFSDQDCEDFKTLFDVPCNFPDPTGTPVSFTRRNRRRKLDVIMSSDSEDEFVNDHLPASSDKGANSELDLEVNGCFTSDCPSMQNGVCPSLDLQLYSEEKLEENCYNCSELLPVKETCKSLDISCVPESSFVPETEINTVVDVLFDSQVTVDFEENCSKRNPFPFEFDSPDKSKPTFYKNSGWLGSCCDTVGVSSHEEVGDSQNGPAVSSMSEHEVMMDECSRFDFNRKFELTENLGPSIGTNLVREKWTKLRSCHTDLRHLVDLELTDASRILKVTYGMSNLISEAELLLSKCQTDDSFESTMALSEVTDARRWSDEQLQMTSTITHCGFGVYAKDVAGVESKLGADCKMDLVWYMPSTTGMMDIGSFGGQMLSSKTQQTDLAEMRMSESGALLTSELKPCFVNMLQSLVPSRLYLSVKGDSSHEYISYLGHISRLEASRLSEDIGHTRRLRRRARNYLSTGSLSLSPEEISLLGQSNLYGKISSQSTDTTFR